MPGFLDYAQGDDGLLRFQREDGGWTPGLLPTGASQIERQRIDALRPLAPQAMPGEQIVTDTSPTMRMQLASDAPPDAAGQGASSPGSLPEPAGAGGAPAASQPAAGGSGGAGGASGVSTPADAPAAASPGGGGGDVVKVGGGGGDVSPADRDKATAAALARERGRRALMGSPGVYDPGGERLTGYTVQRQGFTPTAALREDERGLAPPGVLQNARAQLDAIPGQIQQLQQLAKKDKKNAPQYEAQARSLAGEYARLQRALGPSRDGEPGDLAAMRDVEAKEKRVGFVDNDIAFVGAREAEEQADTLKVQEQQRAADAVEKTAFYERRKAALSDVYGQLDAKRKEYESADVNPNRLFQNASTGQTIAAALFTALGAFGQAMAGDNGPNRSMEILQAAVDQDIKLQLQGIDKKGKELGQLAQTYEFAKDKFGSEEAGMLAAQLAAGDALRAKIERTAAEAGTERAKLQAQRLLAVNDAAQAQRRLQLEQASVGTRADQVRVDQAGWKGGSGPNLKAGQEAFADAAKLGDPGDRQQVTYNGQPHLVGAFVSPTEGAEARKRLNLVNTLKGEINAALKLRGAIGTDPLKKQEYTDHINTIAGMRSVLIDQGVLQGNEREEFQGLSGSLLSGDDVLNNINKMTDRLAKGQLDQLQAKPAASGQAQPWDLGIGPAAPGGSAPAKKGKDAPPPKPKPLPKAPGGKK